MRRAALVLVLACVALAAAPAAEAARSAPCPRGAAGDERTFDTRALVGLKLSAARRLAAKSGCTVRVTIVDGKPRLVTKDFRSNRVNVSVRRWRVVRVVGVG